MAKTIPQLRSEYAVHQNRAALFGVGPLEFNDRVRKRFGNSKPYPEAWVVNAYLEVQVIGGRRCCPKADVVPCVCEVSFRCPDHGGRCFGSHD
jgi:hypothetical protein